MALCNAMPCSTGSCANKLPLLEVSRNLDNTVAKRRYYLMMALARPTGKNLFCLDGVLPKS